ncbi:MAG: NADH-quinone oxidoreductase subunit NuoE [Bauldia sp.]
MSVRRLAEEQPPSFAFTQDNRAKVDREIAKYPAGRQASAVIGALYVAQSQGGGWLPEPAIRHVAEILDMPFIRVLEVATFYTMFNLHPVGRKAHIQVCGTTPCMLRGAEALKQVCRDRIHPEQDHVSENGDFSWIEVECAGACVNAPMVQIEADTFEDLTVESFNRLIDDIAAGRPLRPGPQIDRHYAEPVGGGTTLQSPGLYGQATARAPEPVATPANSDDAKPAGIAGPRGGKADDLTVISGIGPKIEKTLHDLGIFHFDQIAAWSPAEVNWVSVHLAFPGRIAREDWVGQARKLAVSERS